MQAKFFIVIFLLLNFRLSAQTGEGSAFIWQGFEQEWSYNHWIAGLGSYVQNGACRGANLRCNSALVQGTALYGEEDKTAFVQYGAFVRAEGVKFYSDTVSFVFTEKEQKKLSADRTIIVPDGLIYPGEDDYTLILNGFNLVSEDRADGLEDFSVSVSDGIYEPSKKGMVFEVSASLRANCKGKKCGCKNRYRYRLTVHYLVVSGQAFYGARSTTISQKYYWDTRTAPVTERTRVTFPGDSSQKYAVGLPVFKRITVGCDRPYRFAAVRMALAESVYENNSVTCVPMLFGEQWQEDNSLTFNKHTRKSRKKAGFMLVSAEVAVLQFEKGCMKPEIIQGTQSVSPESEPEYRSGYETTLECR